MILLERMYTPFGTWGKLSVDDFTCWTIERAWVSNKKRVSCIPEGIYNLQMRESPVVKRTTGAEFTEGWEVTSVPDRTFIMIHPANWPDDLAGCIAPGKEARIVDDRPFVSHSRDTFRELMSVLETRQSWDIDIRTWRPEYP